MASTRRPPSPERAVDQLLRVIDGLGPAENGRFFGWNGEKIPW